MIAKKHIKTILGIRNLKSNDIFEIFLIFKKLNKKSKNHPNTVVNIAHNKPNIFIKTKFQTILNTTTIDIILTLCLISPIQFKIAKLITKSVLKNKNQAEYASKDQEYINLDPNNTNATSFHSTARSAHILKEKIEKYLYKKFKRLEKRILSFFADNSETNGNRRESTGPTTLIWILKIA